MAKRIVWTDQAKSDVRSIEQSVAIQILKTLGRYTLTGEGAIKQLKGITPPILRLRAQNHRIFIPRTRRHSQDRTRPRPQRSLQVKPLDQQAAKST
jgi:hypothetical protein